MPMTDVEPNLTSFVPTSGVYALVDPRTSRVMYIGKSIDIDYRYRQHLNSDSFDGNRAKHRWVEELKALGLVPKLVIIAEAPWPSSDDVEKQYIKIYKATGQCELNRASGGMGNRSASKLSNSHRDDWFQVGRRIKAVREEILEIAMEAGRLGGPKMSSLVLEASHSLDKSRPKLEGHLRAQFPNWDDICRVFYGREGDRE
jgi:hypothetical protein